MKKSLFLLLIATALLYYPMYLEEFEQPKSLVLVAFSCFAAFFVSWRQVVVDKVAAALLLFCVSAGGSTILSIDTHMSLFGNIKCPCGLFVLVSYFVVYLAATSLDKSDIEQVFNTLTATSIAVSGYALLQVTGHDFMTWLGAPASYGYTRPLSFMGHPNFMAEYLAMALPALLWRFNQNWRVIYRAFYGAATAMSIAAIFFSQSRGMWIAAFISVNLYLVLIRTSFIRMAIMYSIAATILALCLAASPQVRHTFKTRIENVVILEPGRVEYMRGAVKVWQRYPFFGVGTDAFELGFQHQRTPYYWKIESAGSPHKAHNEFLNILATQGIFGAISALLLTLAVGLRLLRTRAYAAMPMIAGVVAFYVASLSSFTVISSGCLFMVYLACLREGHDYA